MNRTLAAVVTFNPDLDRLRQNLTAIAGQVEAVLVFDNGSGNAEAVELLGREFANLIVHRSPDNVGIAEALNQVAAQARDHGFCWLLTLDQDSVAAEGMVRELLDVADASTAMVTPYIVDRNKMTVPEYHRLCLPRVEYYTQAARRGAITSGCLTSLRVLFEVGCFDAGFFIDYVDYDLNQRVLLAGHRIARANHTFLLHEVGRAERTWLRVPRKGLDGRWRLERFYSFGHSAFRCYFKARNRVLFTRKYGRRIGVTHEGIWQIPQQIALTLLFETDRRPKLAAFVRGIRDGVRMPIAPREPHERPDRAR